MGSTAGEHRHWLPLWVAGLGVCLGYLAVEWVLLSGDLGFPLDDSWIHLVFARNLARGNGLAYNPGEVVAGTTAPLWTALLSLLFTLPGNVVAWVKALGVGLHLAGIHAVYRLGRELGLSPGAATLAGGLYLGTYWMAWSALAGMEIPLFVLLTLWGMILHLRERRADGPPRSLAVLGAAALARPEGMLLIVLAVVDRLLAFGRGPGGELALRPPRWRPVLSGLAAAALALLPVLLFYRLAAGSFLPATFGAKTGAVHRLLPQGLYLYTVLGIWLRPQPVMTLLAGAGALRLAARLGTDRDRGLLPALWVLALPLAFALLTPAEHVLVGNFGRYFFPLFAPLVVLGMVGLEEPARRLGRAVAAGPARLPLRAPLIALLLAPTAITLVQGAARYGQNVANVQDGDVALGRWMRDHLPPEALVAVQDVGAVKFFAPNPVLDLVGLVTPEIQPHLRRGAEAVYAFLSRRRPEYLMVYPGWFPGLLARPGFRPAAELKVPGNVTLAADTLTVYTTPWTRRPPRADRH